MLVDLHAILYWAIGVANLSTLFLCTELSVSRMVFGIFKNNKTRTTEIINTILKSNFIHYVLLDISPE